ncbi:MAG TPA: MarR family winged helix-turn-helix transcriptional regulator [Caulobacteraceae bacterium]|jgi:DNA-binding MarR family transcriptional regulator|nr:MarR family winged helix-turn-helix transcriptional regulator [Caulobacteraceae bacterium]
MNPDGPGLTLDDYLPYRLSVAANAVSDLIAGAYRARFGLSIPQWRLVAVLGEDGPSTQQALSTRTRMDKVTVSRAAAALTERKLVSRTPNETDGRSHRIGLTPAGQALYADVAPSALAYEARLLEGLAPAEQRAAHALLRRLELAAAALTAPPAA